MNGSGPNYNHIPSGDIGSWVAVIICLAFIPPLGILLLLRKVIMSTKSRNSASYNTGSRYQPYTRPGYGRYTGTYRQYQNGTRPQGQPYQNGGTAAPQQPPQTGTASAAGWKANQYQNPAVGQPYYKSNPAQAKAPNATSANPQDSNRSRPQSSPGGKGAAPGKKQTSARNLAVVLTVLAVVLGIMGVIFLSSGLSALAVAGLSVANLGMTIFGGFSLLSAAISAFMRGAVLRRVRRFNKYAAVICDRDVVSVAEIARSMGEPTRKTRKSLQDMIDSGFYGEQAYIDSGLESFVKSREAAEKARGASDAAARDKEKSASSENQYVSIVNELHMLCSQTSDPVICDKIARIEELTVKIFKIVEEHPEKTPQLRRFMNYYLPTTLKLLHSYQTLERQGIAGENITSAKQDIERILDTLASGFEQQLDNLFKADKLDISADIDVIENLMEQDGLTGDGIMRTAGGN